MVWDIISARLTFFDPDGALVRTIPVEGLPTRYAPESPFPLPTLQRFVRDASGGLRSVALGSMAPPSDVDTPTPRIRTVEIPRFDPQGRFERVVVETPGSQWLQVPRRVPGPARAPTHNAPTTWVALDDDRSHVAVSTRFEVRSYDADGRLLQRTGYPRLERPFTPDEWERRRREVERIPTPRGATPNPERRSVVRDDRWRPDLHWPYAEIRTDAAGNIWLRGGPEPPRWLVLAPDGAARAVAEIGHGYHIQDIGHDHILVKRRNALHVPIVKVLPIVRVARSGS
jgi:hypothetical protein